MIRKEVILIEASIANERTYKVKLSDKLKAMRKMARRARRIMTNRSARVLPGSLEDYYYAKRCIHHIENALRGKYNIIVVSNGALNMLKKEGAKREKKP